MQERPPIVITKILVPGKRSGLYRRPRLLNFLHDHIQRKLILVAAAAGYGKTSLLADFAHDTDLPVCWYALDEGDRDPHVLAEYLIATIRQRFPQFGHRSAALLGTAQTLADNPYPLVSALVNEIYETIPEYFVVVMDDYHLVADSPPIELFLDLFLRYLPDNCHLILASRTMPRLPLLRLAAYREVAGIGNDDLRFTAEEIAGLMRLEFGLEIPPAAAEELARESEGWITGILLTTRAAWRNTLSGLARARGAPEQVFQYLASEVFAGQPEEIQRFLLASSILRQMNPRLCDSILGLADSGRLLEAVERANLFVTRIEEQETWYKYHHLFQGFLQARLRAESGEEFTERHLRAAHYFDAQGNAAEAIYHYFQVQAYDDARRRIAAIAEPTFEAGRLATLSGWIDALPAPVLGEAPELLVMRARIHMARGELHQAERVLDEGERLCAASGDLAGRAQALVYRSMVHAQEGKYRTALDGCRQALDLLSSLGAGTETPAPDAGAAAEGSRRVARLTAAARRNIGVSLWGMGRLAPARRELEQALALYEALGDTYHRAHVHQELASCLRALGNLAGAHLHYQRSRALWEQIGNPAPLSNVLNSMAVGLYQRGEYDKALDLFQQALEKAREATSWRFQGYILAGMGDVHRALRDYEACRQLYNDALDLATRVDDGQLTVYALDALGNTARLRGDRAAALGLLRHAEEEAARHGSDRELGLVRTSLGILLCESGEHEAALEQLGQARSLLENAGARLDLARVRFHLAQTLYAARRWDEALEHLLASLDLSDEFGTDQHLVADGQRALPLLQYAARRLDDRRVMGLIARIEEFEGWLASRAGLPPGRGAQGRPPPVLEIFAFGKGTVFRDASPVTQSDWGAAQARELFFYILAHPNRSKEQIGAVFWPDLSPARMTSTFHATLYRVRRAVGRECILYEDERYRFNDGLNYRFDVEEFESLLARADQAGADAEAAAECWRKAIALYRGDYLEDVYSDWAAPQRESLLQRHAGAVIRLAAFLVERGEYGQAAQLYTALLEKDNLREDVHRRLMACYARAGERGKALQHYERLVALLERELAAPPAPETVALHEQILRSG